MADAARAARGGRGGARGADRLDRAALASRRALHRVSGLDLGSSSLRPDGRGYCRSDHLLPDRVEHRAGVGTVRAAIDHPQLARQPVVRGGRGVDVVGARRRYSRAVGERECATGAHRRAGRTAENCNPRRQRGRLRRACSSRSRPKLLGRWAHARPAWHVSTRTTRSSSSAAGARAARLRSQSVRGYPSGRRGFWRPFGRAVSLSGSTATRAEAGRSSSGS